MKIAASSLVVLSVCLTGCLENEEEITVHADGSAVVRMSAEGKAEDLGDGYSIPLDPPWRPTDARTREWLQLVGDDTGSATVRAALNRLDRKSDLFLPGKEDETRLEVSAEFRSVDRLPVFLAPATDPYQSAFLERHTTLTTRIADGHKVLVFERHYPGRTYARYDIWERMKNMLPKDVAEALDKIDHIPPEHRARIASASVSAFRSVLDTFREDALSAVWLSGHADLDPAAMPRMRETTLRAITAVVTEERVLRVLAAIDASKTELSKSGSDQSAADELARFEGDGRDALRRGLAAGLAAEGVSAESSRQALTELERLFTSHDHTEDLGDESFRVIVHLPGRIVGGNATSTDGGTATFEFKGEALRDHEHVLRAISISE